MTSPPEKPLTQFLPIKNHLTTTYPLSLIIAFLMTAVSLGGLFFPAVIYPLDELRQAYLANDAVNLIVGLPILLGSMWLTKRGKLAGLLCWPGALLYTFYNYIAYVIGMPLGWLTALFMILVLLCVYLTFVLLKEINWHSVQNRLAGKVHEKISGGVLIFYGVAFFFLAIGVITGSNTGKAGITMPEIGVAIADLILSTLLFIGGISLFLCKPLGYASGMGLLFATSALFIGVILIVLLQPILTTAPFVLEDLIVLFGMGLICMIPTGLFLRGVMSEGN